MTMSIRVGDWQWRNPLVSCAGGRKFVKPGGPIAGDAERRVRARGVACDGRQRASCRSCGCSGQRRTGGHRPDPLQCFAGQRCISRYDPGGPVTRGACGPGRRIRRGGRGWHARARTHASNAGGTSRAGTGMMRACLGSRINHRADRSPLTWLHFARCVPAGRAGATILDGRNRRQGIPFRCNSVAFLRRQRGRVGLADLGSWTLARTQPRCRRIQPVATVMLLDQLPVAKSQIATLQQHYTLRSYHNPTTIHGDARLGFGTAGATGAIPMGCT